MQDGASCSTKGITSRGPERLFCRILTSPTPVVGQANGSPGLVRLRSHKSKVLPLDTAPNTSQHEEARIGWSGSKLHTSSEDAFERITLFFKRWVAIVSTRPRLVILSALRDKQLSSNLSRRGLVTCGIPTSPRGRKGLDRGCAT